MKILLTGCAGFIGSNFLKKICMESEDDFVIIDSLSYAGFYTTIQKDIESNKNLIFIKMDITDKKKLMALFDEHDFDGLINFAAESHVDRSIKNPNIFIDTNITGTANLLNESRKTFERKNDFRFLQVSTDEVYGSLSEKDIPFNEETPLAPNSPYSASKASADMLVRSFNKTYGLPTIITRCSNNYGPYQLPEKFIPTVILNAINDLSIPIYGDGKNIRDWIYVEDHVSGIWKAFRRGKIGDVYNFGSNNEQRNMEIASLILEKLGKSKDLITFVEDRPGHDWRYAIDFTKSQKTLDWFPETNLDEGIKKTIDWYIENKKWIHDVSKTT